MEDVPRMNTDMAATLEEAVKNCPLEPGDDLLVEAVYRRFWWPDPLARPLLWRTRVVGYRYFLNGREVELTTLPGINNSPNPKRS